MKKLNNVFVRHGLHLADLDKYIAGHKTLYGKYILQTMELSKTKDEKSIDKAIRLVLKASKSPGRETLIDGSVQELPLPAIDPYVRGISRWMNELGIHTIGSCDGHNERPASIYLKSYIKPKQLKILEASLPSSISLFTYGKKIQIRYKKGFVADLLKMAENLYTIWRNPKRLEDFEAMNFKSRLVELLNIAGESGNEREIRRNLEQKLRRIADYQFTDRKGNLLGYKACGEGPTILLSAHMDTFERIKSGRKIVEEGTILRSSNGILGADDRAGIAIILEVLSKIHQSNFNGIIKFAFTVEEEVGLRGALNMDTDFLEDVNAAIVIDRRGNRDIVTSCHGVIPFCSESYGRLFEKAGRMAGMADWKMTPGGSSDAKVFAEMGIPSVNLSAGYRNEHTEQEYVDYRAAFETVKLVRTVLHKQLIK